MTTAPPPLKEVITSARTALANLYTACESASSRLDALERLVRTEARDSAFTLVILQRITLDERFVRYYRRGKDLGFKKQEGEEQQRLAAAMAMQESRSGMEVVERLGRFSLDGDEGCCLD
jgi:hypothetical protein